MNNILITGIGGDIGQGVASIIRETFPDAILFGSDIHDRHAGTLFVDKYIRAPKATSDQYVSWLEATVTKNHVDICLPLSEPELQKIASSPKSELSNLKLLMPCQQAIHVGSDKLLTAQYLEQIGCPAPWTVDANMPTDQVEYPCIFKPRRGAGSKGVTICHSHKDVEQMLHFQPDSLLQELLLPESREITCGVFRSKNGQIAVIQMLRQLAWGMSGWVEVVDYPDISEQCARIATALDLRGSINIQMRITVDGPRIFEINPRFSSTVLMRHKLGFQDVVWSILDVLNQDFIIQKPTVGAKAARIQGVALL